MKHFIIAALVVTVCAGSFAIAKGDGDEGERGPEKAKAATPIQKILKELKGLVAREKAKP